MDGDFSTQTDNGVFSQAFAITIVPPPSIVSRHIFYNDSAFHGNDPSVNVGDDAAIPTGKTPLLPGSAAAFANYITGADGVTGIMIDVRGLTGTTVHQAGPGRRCRRSTFGPVRAARPATVWC